MAQSIREPINLVSEPSKVTRTLQNTVPDLLLQQHRLYWVEGIVNRIARRALLILNLGSVAIVSHLSLMHLIASVSVAVMLSLHWYYEIGLRKIRLKAIEEELAKRSGEEWEDIYIKTSYFSSEYRMKFRPFLPEVVVWAMFVIIFAIARFAFT